MKAPTFKLKDTKRHEVKLPDKGKVVLYFYPKADTPGCTTEAKKFSELYPDFIQANTFVIGISPDSVEKACTFHEKYGFGHVLLSDPDHKVAEKYGAWGKKKFMGKEYDGVFRKTFLIHDGEIVKTWDKHKPGKTEHEVLEAAREL